MKKIQEKIYEGNVKIDSSNVKEWKKKLSGFTKISGDLYISSNCTLPQLTSVGGYLYIYSNCTVDLPQLTSVGGNLFINSKNEELEKRLWKKCKKNKWYISEHSSEYIIKAKPTNAIYRLNNVEFTREWFLKILNGKLSASQVFAIDNIEHRRIAYEFMDKSKMKALKDYKVLDEVKDDGYGFPMRIVSFTVQNMKTPLLFFNCHCPSTGREYFIGTDKNICAQFKTSAFGVDNDAVFEKEW